MKKMLCCLSFRTNPFIYLLKTNGKEKKMKIFIKKEIIIIGLKIKINIRMKIMNRVDFTHGYVNFMRMKAANLLIPIWFLSYDKNSNL